MAPVQKAVQQGSRHDLVVQDLSSLLEALVRGQHRLLTIRAAAGLLRVNYTQAKRMLQCHREGGTALRRGWAGKRPHRANPDGLHEQVLELVRHECGGGAGDGFGPTLVGRQGHSGTWRRRCGWSRMPACDCW